MVLDMNWPCRVTPAHFTAPPCKKVGTAWWVWIIPGAVLPRPVWVITVPSTILHNNYLSCGNSVDSITPGTSVIPGVVFPRPVLVWTIPPTILHDNYLSCSNSVELGLDSVIISWDFSHPGSSFTAASFGLTISPTILRNNYPFLW